MGLRDASALKVLTEERTLRLLLMPLGTLVVTLIMSNMNGKLTFFVSGALNSRRPEPTQQLLARYYMWHLTFFGIASFKLRKLPKGLLWIAYLNVFACLACIWTGFRSFDRKGGSWTRYAHWVASALIFIVWAVETPAVWWKRRFVAIAYAVLVVVYIVLFLAADSKLLPDTGIQGLGRHWEFPLEYVVLWAHLIIVWYRTPRMEDAQSSAQELA